MDGDNSNHRPRVATDAQRVAAAPAHPERRRTPWGLAAVAVLFVVVPFLTWYGTSFWRPLSDEQLGEYLRDRQKLRHVQHALEEIDRRVVKRDEGVKRWYQQVVEVSADPSPDLRMTAAWVMGDDNNSETFHAALPPLLNDQEPAVRRMAALSLSRFNDARARPELVAMLRAYEVRVGVGGTIVNVLPVGSRVRRGAMIARVRGGAGSPSEVRAPVSGRVERIVAAEGANVSQADVLLVLAPDAENVLQSLRALFLVGASEELPEVERYVGGVAGMPEGVQKQAAQTAEAIKSRASKQL